MRDTPPVSPGPVTHPPPPGRASTRRAASPGRTHRRNGPKAGGGSVPTFGRFISEDRLGFGGGDFNLYAYARNSPLNGRDPRGTQVALPLPPPVVVITTAVVVTYIAGRKFLRWTQTNGDPWGPPLSPMNGDGGGGGPPAGGGPPGQPTDPPNFKDPTKPPGPDWEWKGKNPTPGSREGSWYNPNTDESLHPNLDHPPPIDPHYDWLPPGGGPGYRIFPDGRIEPK
jgi:hypothetical protein